MLKSILILSFILITPHLVQAKSVSDFSPLSHWTCDETSGVRYDSVTATANDLTDNNTVGTSTGLRGLACDFEKGNSEFLSINDNTSLSLTGAQSYSFWIKPESLTSSDVFISKWQESGNQRHFAVDVQSGIVRFLVSTNGNNPLTVVSATSSISAGNWYHFVMVFRPNSEIAMYVNGKGVATTTLGWSTLFDSTAAFKIGSASLFAGGTRYYDGLMDEITVFNRNLLGSEVNELFNNGTPLSYTTSLSANAVPLVLSDNINIMLENVNCVASVTSTNCDYSYVDGMPITLETYFYAFFIFLGIFFTVYWTIRKLTT